MYKNGYSSYAIGDAFDMCYKQIIEVLKEKNIPRVYSGGKRTYTLNERYFENIDSQDKAYILGFLFADGNVSLPNNEVRINLKEEDREILEKMRKAIGSSRPLIYNPERYDTRGYINKPQYKLSVQSYLMCQDLINLGCIENKSLKIDFPNIDEKYYSHFLRGYFDGDGSIYTGKGKYKSNYVITFTSTEDFLITAKDIIAKETGITGGGIYDASCHNNITKVLTFSGRNQTKAICDWMYKDSDMYLKRKHDRYMSYYYNNIDNSLSA